MPAALLTVDPAAPEETALQRAAAAIAQGALVGYPTDTFYGVAADPRHAEAISRLYDVKARPPSLAVPLIAADLTQVNEVAARLSPLASRLAERWWPGPLTVVVEAAAALDVRVLGADATVAVRVPAHAVATGVARACGHAITATSANLSGQPAASTAGAVVDALGDGVAIVIDAGPTPGGAPSTIVDARGETPGLVREGVVAWDRVLQSLA